MVCYKEITFGSMGTTKQVTLETRHPELGNHSNR